MILIKIGGGASINLPGIIRDLSQLQEKYIIVHGANAARDKLAQQLGLEKEVVTSVSGFSSVLTDDNAIDLIMMSYAGLVNKRIVALCQQHGINAVGLSGLDGRTIQGKKNQGFRVQENGKVRIVRDQSGKSKTINKKLLNLLMSNGYTPVLCIPIIGEDGEPLNSENDDIVHTLQNAFKAEKVIHLIEAPGLLEKPSDESSLILKLSQKELSERIENSKDRMKRKLYSISKLFESGVKQVVISDGRSEHPVTDALSQKGTVIS